MSSTPVVLSAKRKRGRPRKDGNAAKKGEGSQQPPATPNEIRAVQQLEPKTNDRSMVGMVVSGVIDGSFDAGYFLSVRIGNNGPLLRGVIFEPGRIMPISLDNDVAPHVKLFQRTEMPMAAPKPQDHGNGIGPQVAMQPPSICNKVLPSAQQSNASYVFHKQSPSSTIRVMNTPMNNSSSSLVEKIVIQQKPNFDYQIKCHSIPPAENLRMVEQDETMQAYEVSIQSEGVMADAGSAKDWMSESSARQSANNFLPHKEFEPSKLAHYDLENHNFGILRDFVAGNHHYLPPEVISDQPGEFMVEKPNSPKNNNAQATQLEPKATGLGNNESSPSGKPISDPVDGNQQNSKTREAMPFDLELAAEEPPQPGKPENIVSCSTSNQCGLSDTEPR